MDDDSSPPDSVAKDWERFDRDILRSMGPLSDEVRELVKKKFYEGGSAALSLAQTELKGVTDPSAIRQTLQSLRKASEQIMEEDDEP